MVCQDHRADFRFPYRQMHSGRDWIGEREPPAFEGEVSRLVLNALRKSGKPIPVSDLTLIVAAGRGINPDDKPFMRTLSRRVGAGLRNLRKKDLVRMTRVPGSLGLWEVRKPRADLAANRQHLRLDAPILDSGEDSFQAGRD